MECLGLFVYFMLVNIASAGLYGIQWSYSEGVLDQTHWKERFPACGGQNQSPIDIQRQSVHHNPKMLKLKLTGYDAQTGKFLMLNTGYTVLIKLPPSMAINSGLPDRYTAVQMHLHWGGMNLESSGAEHTLDGIRYFAELHIVHYNSEKYKSFEEATDKPNGLAVLAFFFENGNFENTYYRDFINNLSKVKYAGQSMNISSLNVRSMLPKNLNHFFRYKGSLTNPPCYESVLWTVFDEPITLSHNQIKKMEKTLMAMNNNTMWDYYRMTQPLNHRMVESSFQPHQGKGTLFCQEEMESKLLKMEVMITNLGKHSHLAFSHQEAIKSKLLKIESLITSFGKHTMSVKDVKASKKEPKVLFPLVLQFPKRNRESYAVAHLAHPMDLHSFTVCMHLRTRPAGVHSVLSYSSQGNDNELMVTIGYEVGLWIGNQFVNMPHNFHSHEWANYCITWTSRSGGAKLVINGIFGQVQYIQGGYTLSPSGVFILGKDQDGFLGISDTDAFVGQMTDLNVWDYVLTTAEIQEQRSCHKNTSLRGNVLSWGVTHLTLYGGVQLETDYRCP